MAEKNPLVIAFEMGKRAFYKGIFDAPYKEGTVLLKEWQRGFNHSYFDNQSKLSSRP